MPLSSKINSAASGTRKFGIIVLSFSVFVVWLTVFVEASLVWSRPYYYFFADKLPLSSQVISANVIDYVLGKDEMRTGPFGLKEIRHLDDVRQLISRLKGLCIALLLLNAILAARERKHYLAWLRPAAKMGMSALPVFGVPALLLFDKFFYIFHLVFFRNIFWSLNPRQDLLIQVFPPAFFSFSLFLLLLSLFLNYIAIYLLTNHRKKRHIPPAGVLKEQDKL
jgi:integral membrane protein (TIGR01906 family)